METSFHIRHLRPHLLPFVVKPLIIMALWLFLEGFFKTMIILFYNKIHARTLITGKARSDFLFLVCPETYV